VDQEGAAGFKQQGSPLHPTRPQPLPACAPAQTFQSLPSPTCSPLPVAVAAGPAAAAAAIGSQEEGTGGVGRPVAAAAAPGGTLYPPSSGPGMLELSSIHVPQGGVLRSSKTGAWQQQQWGDQQGGLVPSYTDPPYSQGYPVSRLPSPHTCPAASSGYQHPSPLPSPQKHTQACHASAQAHQPAPPLPLFPDRPPQAGTTAGPAAGGGAHRPGLSRGARRQV